MENRFCCRDIDEHAIARAKATQQVELNGGFNLHFGLWQSPTPSFLHGNKTTRH